MALWLCIIAIVISILVGWKFKLNTGIIARGVRLSSVSA